MEDKRSAVKRKLSASSPSPPLRRRIRPLSKKEFIPPPFPLRLPSSNTFFGPIAMRPKTEEEREDEVCKDAIILGQAADAYAAHVAAGHRAGRAHLQGQEAGKQLLALRLRPQVLPPQPRCPQAALPTPSEGLGTCIPKRQKMV